MSQVATPKSPPRKRWLLAVLALVVVALVLAFLWWRVQNGNYEGPPTTMENVPEISRSSVITVPVVASLDEIQNRLNSEIPTTLHTIDENRDACVPSKRVKIGPAKIDVSPEIDCNLKGTVTREAISVGGAGDALTVTMPVSARVTAKGRGEIGKNFQETADGKITANASVRADLTDDWEPVADVNADYSWNDRIGVDILGIRITFASSVDPQIKQAIEDFRTKVPELLAGLKLKEKAAEGWSKGFTVVQIASSPDVWLRFTPEAVGFEGYSVDGRTLRTAIMAGGKTETFVGARPADPVAVPLPALQRALPDPSFNVFVPVSADYGAIEDEAEKGLKVGQAQTIEVPNVGPLKVTFRKVDVHQTTGGKLAVGVDLLVDTSWNIFDTSGEVWIVTDVEIDSAGKRVKVGKLDVFSQTDNAPVDLLVNIVNLDAVNREVRKALEYDFSKNVEDAVAQANAAMNRQVADDVYLVGKLDGVDLEKIVAGPRSLLAYVSAKGSAELHFGKLGQ